MDAIGSRGELARELRVAREHAGLTVRELARRLDIPTGTLGGYLSGRHLPATSQTALFVDLLAQLGISDPAEVERWLAALTRVRAASDARISRGPAPYRGLEPFGVEDAAWFFGRDQTTEGVVARLAQCHADGQALLAVVGPSGAGKSSMLRAGLVPALGAGTLAGRRWACALMTPGEDPVAALHGCLTELGDDPGVIIIDQFEEAFTLCTDRDRRHEFFAALAALDAGHRLAVLGLRADFYDAAAREPALVPVLAHAQLLVTPMSTEQLRAAIVEPARRAGATVDDDLVDVLLDDMAPHAFAATSRPGERAHDPGSLPLFSHALLATWEHAGRNRITVADYRAIGGIGGAIEQSAEACFQRLDPEQQAVARRIFMRLVAVRDDVAPTRRRVHDAELARLGDDEHAVRTVLDTFVNGRLITAGAGTVEISHEALLASWERLRKWLDADRAGLVVHRDLTVSANAWERAGHDPGALLRGRRLEAVEEWLRGGGHDDDLNQLEREFRHASVEQAERERRALRRRSRNRRTLLAAAVVVALITTGLSVVALRSRADAQHASHRAEQARDAALSRQGAIEAERLRSTDPGLARQLALAAYRISPTADARSALLASSGSLAPTRILGPEGPMQALAPSPDGRLLAATGADGALHLWSLARPTRPVAVSQVTAATTSATLFAVAFSPDGHVLATAGAGRVVQLFDVSDPAHPRRIARLAGATNTNYSLAFSPRTHLLAAASADMTIHLWDVADPHHPVALPSLRGFTNYVQAVAFGDGGRWIAGGGADGTLRLWSLADPQHARLLTTHGKRGSDAVLSVAFRPGSRMIAEGTRSGKILLLTLSDRGTVRRANGLGNAPSWVNAVAFSPDGALLAAGSSDSVIRVFDVAARTATLTLPNTNPVTSLAFTPDGATLAAASSVGVANLWPLAAPKLTGPSTSVFSVGYDSGGAHLLAVPGSQGGGAELWSTRPAKMISSAIATSEPLEMDGSGAISPDGRLVAVGTSTGPVQLWDTTDPDHPHAVATLAGPTQQDETIDFSPDGDLLAVASDDAHVYLWDVSDPAHPVRLATLGGFDNYVMSAAFGPHGHLLAATSADETARLWDISDPAHPKPLARLTGFGNYAYCVAFSPDGRTLAVGSADKTVRLYDISTPSRPRLLGSPLHGPTDYVFAVAFSPDGHSLAAASNDGSVWLWNVARRRHPVVYATLHVSANSLYALAFSPDGTTIAAAGSDQTIHRYRVHPAAVTRAICSSIGTPITRAEWAQYFPGAAYANPCR